MLRARSRPASIVVSPWKIKSPPPRPLVIFDGECDFCRFWIERWRRQTGESVDYTPLQEEWVGKTFPEIPRDALEKALHLVMPDGTVYSGAGAVLRALSGGLPGRGLVWCYETLPGVAPAAETFYGLVARRRSFFSFWTRLFWGYGSGPAQFQVATRWFLRALGLVYLIAFWSLGVQLNGLVGSHGLDPASELMTAARRQLGGPDWRSVHLLPTFCWWGASDTFLRTQWLAGVLCGVFVVAGLLQGPMLVCLWGLYLSLTTVGGDFMAFQWDNLLLETGFLAIWIAPWRFWAGRDKTTEPNRLARWLLWWLLFRLMLASGWVKLLSGDQTWRNLSALDYHYQTQPLPTPLAWYAHQLPHWSQAVCTGVMFFIELVLPVAIFLPRRLRHASGIGLACLQLLILLTGNYTFFNLLTLALILLLFDDAFFGVKASAEVRPVLPHPRRRLRTGFLTPIAAVVGLVTLSPTASMFGWRDAGGSWVRDLAAWVAPFRTINSYGLFAVMTTVRREIVIEGSMDGRVWTEYEFRDKPGGVKRRPRFVAPYQPRLDWQMWFAALGSPRGNAWFSALMTRLLEGEPETLRLLAGNPFPQQPPQFVRARLYEYRFTSFKERGAGLGWWRRELRGEYFPMVSRRVVRDFR